MCCKRSVDMRKSFHGLEGLVVEQFGRYLIGDEVFVFLSKSGHDVLLLRRVSCGGSQ
ncbi:IS66 family insertion sequence element accessory protein TnpB [Parabacteroides sp. ZJ-118]|uniref:IS66 family insertion sequence element accessory protein TnpB n=1 Tax=Parabacteroides sp. ZJ-118 TaxID=2709398 RepID=UPI00351BB896